MGVGKVSAGAAASGVGKDTVSEEEPVVGSAVAVGDTSTPDGVGLLLSSIGCDVELAEGTEVGKSAAGVEQPARATRMTTIGRWNSVCFILTLSGQAVRRVNGHRLHKKNPFLTPFVHGLV
jgi:hypothetical protein